MPETTSARLLTPAFIALTSADLAYFTAAGVLIAATPLFVTGPLGSDEAGVGLAMGAFSLTTLLLRPLAGRWADRRGRRALLVAGAALFAVVVAGHYLVTALSGLVVLRLVLGAAEAMFFVAGFAALADLAPVGRAGEALSLNSLALYVGVAAGPPLGQLLLRWGGFPLAWAGSVGLAALATLLATRVPETRPPTEPGPVVTPLLHRAAVLPGVALFCGVAPMSAFLVFAVLHAQAVDLTLWSLPLLVFGATVVSCRAVFAGLPDRVPPLRLASAALVTSTVGFLLLAGRPTPAGLLTASLLLGVGAAFVTPAIFAAVFGSVPASERGSAAATTSIFIDVGLGGGPLLVGLLAAATDLTTAFAIAASVPAAGACLAAVTRRRSILEADRT